MPSAHNSTTARPSRDELITDRAAAARGGDGGGGGDGEFEDDGEEESVAKVVLDGVDDDGSS